MTYLVLLEIWEVNMNLFLTFNKPNDRSRKKGHKEAAAPFQTLERFGVFVSLQMELTE